MRAPSFARVNRTFCKAVAPVTVRTSSTPHARSSVSDATGKATASTVSVMFVHSTGSKSLRNSVPLVRAVTAVEPFFKSAAAPVVALKNATSSVSSAYCPTPSNVMNASASSASSSEPEPRTPVAI